MSSLAFSFSSRTRVRRFLWRQNRAVWFSRKDEWEAKAGKTKCTSLQHYIGASSSGSLLKYHLGADQFFSLHVELYFCVEGMPWFSFAGACIGASVTYGNSLGRDLRRTDGGYLTQKNESDFPLVSPWLVCTFEKRRFEVGLYDVLSVVSVSLEREKTISD